MERMKIRKDVHWMAINKGLTKFTLTWREEKSQRAASFRLPISSSLITLGDECDGESYDDGEVRRNPAVNLKYANDSKRGKIINTNKRAAKFVGDSLCRYKSVHCVGISQYKKALEKIRSKRG